MKAWQIGEGKGQSVTGEKKKTTKFALLATFLGWLTFLLHNKCAGIVFPSWEEKQQECGRNEVKSRARWRDLGNKPLLYGRIWAGGKGTIAGGNDIRRAEEAGQQDTGCRLRKKTCVRHCLSVKAYMTFYSPSAQTLLNPHGSSLPTLVFVLFLHFLGCLWCFGIREGKQLSLWLPARSFAAQYV